MKQSSNREEHFAVDLETLRPPRSKAAFSFFNRTVNFYGEVYIGNGTIMKSIVNNQGGSIKGSGGPMFIGNRAGAVSSNIGQRRGFVTRVFRPTSIVQIPMLKRGLHFLGRVFR
jgi:hypothetical protein